MQTTEKNKNVLNELTKRHKLPERETNFSHKHIMKALLTDMACRQQSNATTSVSGLSLTL